MIKVPTANEMWEMTLEEAKEWKEKIKPYYVNRFDLENDDDYLMSCRYLWFDRMIRNIENDLPRFYKIVSDEEIEQWKKTKR